jgi:hypothetical protein
MRSVIRTLLVPSGVGSEVVEVDAAVHLPAAPPTAAPIVWMPSSPSVLASTMARANPISSWSAAVSSRLGTSMRSTLLAGCPAAMPENR